MGEEIVVVYGKYFGQEVGLDMSLVDDGLAGNRGEVVVYVVEGGGKVEGESWQREGEGGKEVDGSLGQIGLVTIGFAILLQCTLNFESALKLYLIKKILF